MNILLISHELSVTGAPHSLLRQAQYFKNAGHNVDIWTLNGGELEQRYITEGFHPLYIHNKEHEIFFAFKKQNKKYDFILCNTTVTYKAVKALQHYNIPLVWFIRETRLVDEGMDHNSAFAKVFMEFNNIYTVSEYAANIIKKYNQNVRVIHNAIEDTFSCFSPVDATIKFGFIGSIGPVKGIDLLIDAYLEVIKVQNNVELYIAGNYNSNLGHTLREKTKNITSIKWLGIVQNEEKERFFNQIDILCMPSLDEPAGLSLIEGAMKGKALITTDTTGANYIVEHGQNGYITKSKDKKALEEAMLMMTRQNIHLMQKYSRYMYEKYGMSTHEKDAVLQMLHDSVNNFRYLGCKITRLKYFIYFMKKMAPQKIKRTNGCRDIYFFGFKIFSYKHR